MIPTWLHILSILSLLIAGGCAVAIAADEWRDPQHMWIMNAVWPLVALFAGPLALWAYRRWGRLAARSVAEPAMARGDEMPSRAHTPFPAMVAKGAGHCGSGCALGDILAEWLAWSVPGVAVAFGWHWVFAQKIFAVWVLDFVIAFAIGVAFQYFTIKPMRDLSVGQGLWAAVKADTLSLAAWQVGMYGFMALAHFWIFGRLLGVVLAVPSPEFWFMMQIAMLAGFATAYPVNWGLIRAGVKERM